jgi:hypothetical protein
MSRKRLSTKVKTNGLSRNAEHIYSAVCGIKEIPLAAYEGCVLVPFALTACIPEGAIRKFAAKEPYSVHYDFLGEKHLICYFGDGHLSPSILKSYQIRPRESSI